VASVLQRKYDGKKQLKDLSADEKIELCDEAEEQQAALIFLTGANRAKYGPLLEELENAYLSGHNSYPHDITSAYNRLLYWSNEAQV